jgi:hypothetical protein
MPSFLCSGHPNSSHKEIKPIPFRKLALGMQVSAMLAFPERLKDRSPVPTPSFPFAADEDMP